MTPDDVTVTEPQPIQEQAPVQAAPLDMDTVLEEYRRRQMIEHLTGPLVSIVVHGAIILACVLFLASSGESDSTLIEVSIRELPVKELDTKTIEEYKKLEAKLPDIVPTVTKPEVSADVASEDLTGGGGGTGSGTAGNGGIGEFSDAAAQTDDGMDTNAVMDVKANQTPLKLAGLYGGRSNEGRAGAGKKFGGGNYVVSESAVMRALKWLKANQSPDGSWSKSSPAAMSGLALLCYLAHGETPDSKEFGATVQKAMQYLANRMASQNGAILEREYSHGIATYALAEAYGMTKIPFLKGAMENGLKILIDGQQFGGGWDYGYAKSKRWDLSVAGWQMQALKAGFIAGAETPGLVEAIEKSINWLKKENYKDGGFCYSNGGGPSPNMTGCGTLCLQLLGEAESSEAKAGVQYINEKCSVVWKPDLGGTTTYGWYYQTQAMFHAGQAYWKKWNDQFSRELTTSQKPDGHWETSREAEYQPYLDTTLCCLMLEVYYRYLPTYKFDIKKPVAAAGGTGGLEGTDTKGLDLELK